MQEYRDYTCFNSLSPGKFFPLFSCVLIFSKSIFSKNSFMNMNRVSNSLDLDQARLYSICVQYYTRSIKIYNNLPVLLVSLVVY